MFLQRIAKAFYNEYKADIRKFTFVFPNRRAGLFFQKYLTELIDKPIFSPEIITVKDCFFNASSRQVADRTAELFRIYRIYKEISKSNENFDAFVFWGEMLLSDFNEIDKSRVDAGKLFKNISDLKEIDWSQEYITEEQREAIAKFWKHFLPTIISKTKEEFIAIWRILLPIYEQFKAELLAENLATEGMIFREVIDQLKSLDVPEYFENKNFVFVGFNALNKSEEMLFEELLKLGKADFYWDYEADELRNNENQASKFYENNKAKFPSKLTVEASYKPLNSRNFKLISIPSSVGQTKEVYNILSELYPENSTEKDWIKTAVVLPEESLLVPLMHSFPENIGNINVTMGFPLKYAPVSALLESIFELQRRMNSKQHFYHLTVTNILNHQYVRMLCDESAKMILKEILDTNSIYVSPELFAQNDILKTIFTPRNEPKKFIDYLLSVLQKLNISWQQISEEQGKYRLECDFLYQYYIAINRMNDVMKSQGEFEMSLDTLVRLIRQLIAGISIPFEGEPLNGLQVMGMLETRGLDFENLIVCSFNEGIFPKKNSSNSFIPNVLRRAFGLPTMDYFDAISAYNFYRLIQRTQNIYFLYDSRTDGLQSGEVSRYVHQLHYHYGVEFEKINITYDVNLRQTEELKVEKTPQVMAKLRDFLSEDDNARKLSASSILDYIQCPLRFYLKQIERIYEQKEVEETVNNGMYGTILHGVMTELYKPYCGKFLDKNTLLEIAKNNILIDKTISREFAKNYFKKAIIDDEIIQLEGKNLLDAKVIKKFVQKIIEHDAERAPFKYHQGEKKVEMRFPIQNGTVKVNLKGFIDRIDEKEGVVRVLDYKTGSSEEMKFKTLDDLFLPNNKKLPKGILQTFLYCLFYLDEYGERKIVPEILKLTDLFKSDFTTSFVDTSANKTVEDFHDYKEEFTEKLTKKLEEIFNPDVPFIQCTEIEICKYCPFTTICRREVSDNSY